MRPAASTQTNATVGPTFRIVVPTYRRPQLLERLLSHLTPQLARLPQFRLIVVNDGSHDERYESIMRSFGISIDYLSLAHNCGPGPARQAGFAGATEDYLVCTDDDCVPPPTWLDRLLALANTYPDVDIFGGTTSPVDLPTGLVSRELVHVPNASPSPVVTDERLITAVTANAMYRRELFEKSRGFADDMTGATEDCFVTQKIVAAGGAWLLDPQLVVGHRCIQSLSELRKKFRGYGYGAAQYVVREQDWRVAALHTNDSWASSLAECWSSAKAQWVKPANRTVPAHRRGVRFVLTFFGQLSYERGWRNGLRHFSRQYGRSRPVAPKLADRYSRHCSEIILKRRSA